MGKNGVDGVYTADPRKDENAKRFATLSYNRALVDNLAGHGCCGAFHGAGQQAAHPRLRDSRAPAM